MCSGQAYELRDASFLWIDSLSEPDQLFQVWHRSSVFRLLVQYSAGSDGGDDPVDDQTVAGTSRDGG